MFIHSLVVVYTIQNDGLLKGICIFKAEIWPSVSIGFLIQLKIGSNPIEGEVNFANIPCYF